MNPPQSNIPYEDALEPTRQLIERLKNQRDNQDFFQAVRLLLRVSRSTIGREQPRSDERIRLRAEASEVYPASELSDTFLDDRNENRAVLEASFFGLYGPMGALPNHYTQMVIDRLRKKDTAFRDFLDIFNHRLLSLFYRAWEKNRFLVAFETAREASVPDLFTECLMSLVGFGNPATRNRQHIPDETWLHYAGLKSLGGPRPDALRGMIEDHFHVPAGVESLRGEWLFIPPQEQTQLAAAALGKSTHNGLGVETVAGARVWAVEHRFRVVLGPVSAKRFHRFTPYGPSLIPLTQFVRTYVGPQFDFDVQVVLDRRDVSGMTIGAMSEGRLGWNSWLGEWRSEKDAFDAVFAH